MAPGDITRAPPGNNAGYSNLTLNNNGTQASGSDVRLINESRPSMDRNPDVPKEYTKFTKYATLLVLFCINLLNYMDRFTIISVLSAVRTAFDINNKQAALLNMVFLISYMILSPVVGYLGDRFNRKFIIIVGLCFWTTIVMLSSFIEGHHDNFHLFLATRAAVGVGEASYSCLAPTVISDLFEKKDRVLVMSVFMLAIPLGSGLGFLAGGKMVELANSMGWAGGWQWSLRVTPPLAVLCIILLLFVMPSNIPRGHSEGIINDEDEKSSYLEDLKYLFTNKSFVAITAGFVGIAFTMGCLSNWFPDFLALAYVNRGDIPPCLTPDCEYSSVTSKFGILTAIAGIVGVAIGKISSDAWTKERVVGGQRKPGNQRADAEICAIGQFVLACGIFGALFGAKEYPNVTWACGLIGMIGGCVNWALMVTMTMVVCKPAIRSTANAVQMFAGHVLGDAFSPFLVGAISDKLKSNREPSYYADFTALQYGMILCPLLSVIGGMCFLIAANHIVADKKKVEEEVKTAYQKLTDSSEMFQSSSSSEGSVNPV